MGSSEEIRDQSTAGSRRLSRRTFIRVSLAGAAVAAVPGAIAISGGSGDRGIRSFDLSFDESVQVVFAFGDRLGTYDITIKDNDVEVERFDAVPALELGRLKSDYVTVTPAAAPAAA